jgi:periplasmic protein TonB
LIKFIKYIIGQVLLLPSFSQSWDDVVFAQRNKLYGAYELRRTIAKNQFLGLAITISIFLALFVFLQFSDNNTQEANFEFEKLVEFKGFDANLISVQPLKKEEAPPEIAKPEEEEVIEEVKKDLPPEVKPDKPVTIAETKKTVNVDSIVKAAEKAGQDTGKKYEAGLDSGIVQPKYEAGPASPYGGLTEFMKWVQQNLVVPKDAKDNNVHGTVYVHFTIDEKGTLTKVTLSKGLGYGCDEAVMEVLRKAPPWKPAVRDGKPVNQRFIIPVKI